ncbi:anion transporter [Clostridium sp. CTA-19]
MIKNFVRNQVVLSIAVFLALITSFISSPKIEYIDFKVLILLFNLMLVVAALNSLKALEKGAVILLKKCKTYKMVSIMLVGMTFIAAMFITNDVALITFVPFAIIVGKKGNIKIMKIVILQTLAANLGSAFTPMGNPQNLFIYSYYNMGAIEFLKTTLPIIILGIIFLGILIGIMKNEKIDFKVEDVKLEKVYKLLITLLLFLIIILSVFNIVNYKFAFILTVIAICVIDRKLLFKVDYSLLITFIGFFIFIGNISQMNAIKVFMGNILNGGQKTYIWSIILSQVISNVPATMLVSGFSEYGKELLLAVNVGGMGTIIASLASVISYKIYTKEYESEGNKYLKIFTVYNLLGLIIFIPIISLLIK